MIKKYILGALIALSIPAMIAYAATPVLSVSGNGDNNNVTVTVTGGEINAPVDLFYNRVIGDVPERRTIGTTDINGNFTGVVSTSGLGITQVSPVYVQVGGYQSLPANWPFGTGTVNGMAITFNQASPNLTLGQNGTITISGGGGGTYYVASNSNPNFTSASISGNTLTLSGSQQGQSSVTVCSTAGPCAVVTPTFSMNGSNTGSNTSVTGSVGSPTLSQSILNVNQGGQGSLILSGGTGPYTVSIPTGSGVSTTLVGNTLYVNGGNTMGSSTIQVCSANNGGCTPLMVNIGATGSTNTSTNTGSGIAFTVPVTVGQSVQLGLVGGTGSYYLQSPVSSPALALLSGSTLTLNGGAIGSGMVTVCQTGGSSCLPINFTVAPALTGTGGGFFYDTDLSVGMTSSDVMELQTRLRDEGYFTATPTGYFGSITQSAVMAYQSAHGLPSTGYVGPLTRAMLNQ